MLHNPLSKDRFKSSSSLLKVDNDGDMLHFSVYTLRVYLRTEFRINFAGAFINTLFRSEIILFLIIDSVLVYYVCIKPAVSKLKRFLK